MHVGTCNDITFCPCVYRDVGSILSNAILRAAETILKNRSRNATILHFALIYHDTYFLNTFSTVKTKFRCRDWLPPGTMSQSNCGTLKFRLKFTGYPGAVGCGWVVGPWVVSRNKVSLAGTRSTAAYSTIRVKFNVKKKSML